MKRMTKSRRVFVADTTLRDGEQAPGFHLTPSQKLRVARALAALRVDAIEAGFPASSDADFRAVRRIAAEVGAGPGAPVITAFGRAVASDVDRAWEAVRRARRPRLHLFIAASDLHMRVKLRLSRGETVARAVDAVRRAKARAPEVQFTPEDGTRADRRFLGAMIRAVVKAGADVINVADTVGYAAPEDVAALVRFARTVAEPSGAAISVHCHDDLGLAVANTLAGVRAGARQMECAVNGIGERAGNCSLEEAVLALRTRADHWGASTGVNARGLVKASRLVASVTGVAVAPNKAVVGANAFAHASGIHQDGLLKDRRTYEIMRPEDVGAGGTRILLTARSGRAALRHRLERLGRAVPESRMAEVFRRFKALADRTAEVSDTDLARLTSI